MSKGHGCRRLAPYRLRKGKKGGIWKDEETDENSETVLCSLSSTGGDDLVRDLFIGTKRVNQPETDEHVFEPRVSPLLVLSFLQNGVYFGPLAPSEPSFKE